jgi:hypothetical protein
MALFGLLFIIIGVVNLFFPQVGWYMTEGWKFKDAEPNDAALIMGRIGGFISVIIGFVIMFNSF